MILHKLLFIFYSCQQTSEKLVLSPSSKCKIYLKTLAWVRLPNGFIYHPEIRDQSIFLQGWKVWWTRQENVDTINILKLWLSHFIPDMRTFSFTRVKSGDSRNEWVWVWVWVKERMKRTVIKGPTSLTFAPSRTELLTPFTPACWPHNGSLCLSLSNFAQWYNWMMLWPGMRRSGIHQVHVVTPSPLKCGYLEMGPLRSKQFRWSHEGDFRMGLVSL